MVKKMNKSQFHQRIEALDKEFFLRYNAKGEDIFSSPGRIELLGNHTDHNLGKVMVSSVDLSILAIGEKTDDNVVYYATQSFPLLKIDLTSLEYNEKEKGNSSAIIRGIASKFVELGYNIGGFRCVTSTTIFKGAGVSSSAAFELLVCQMFNYYYNEGKISPLELARIAQYSESVYFGKPCGLLDQMGIALGGINFIDFKNINSPIYKRINYHFEKYDFVLINTKESHSKLTHLYADIIQDMKNVSLLLGKEYLREVKESEFKENEDKIISLYGEKAYLRCKHYFEENRRVDKAYKALKEGDEFTFKEMMKESGNSSYYQLKNCYIVSEDECLPTTINDSKGLINDGACRVHGGGFAGTVLCIIDKNESQEYIRNMRHRFGFFNVRKVNLIRYGTRYVGKVSEYLNG